MNPELLLKLTALTYVGIAAAGACMPRAVDLWKHTRSLPPFDRNLFKVYYGFICFLILSCGLLTWFFAEELAGGSPLARAVCLMMGGFWLIRLGVALFVFDVRPYLTNGFYRVGYQATNIVFGSLPFIYGWVALVGGAQ